MSIARDFLGFLNAIFILALFMTLIVDLLMMLMGLKVDINVCMLLGLIVMASWLKDQKV